MSDTRFDVTFIRGPRDVSAWKKANRELSMLQNSPQNNEDALRARAAYREKRDEIVVERYPNAMYQQKGSKR